MRLFDILFSLLGLALMSPLFLSLLLATRVEDGEGVFFLQARLGHKRRVFRIIKFRTMRKGDVTRVGRWLRPTGLDEIAQFFNVLKGEMSIVGPRPLTSDDVNRLKLTGPEYDERWELKPGMTGLPGVFGSRRAAHSRRLDKLYFYRQSFGLNIRLILISFGMSLFGKAQVRKWLRKFRRYVSLLRRLRHAILPGKLRLNGNE